LYGRYLLLVAEALAAKDERTLSKADRLDTTFRRRFKRLCSRRFEQTVPYLTMRDRGGDACHARYRVEELSAAVRGLGIALDVLKE